MMMMMMMMMVTTTTTMTIRCSFSFYTVCLSEILLLQENFLRKIQKTWLDGAEQNSNWVHFEVQFLYADSCMSKFQIIFIRMQYQEAKLRKSLILFNTKIKFAAVCRKNCNFVPPSSNFLLKPRRRCCPVFHTELFLVL